MSKADLITIGRVITPHGVRGDIRVYPITDFPERFLDMDHCYIDGKEYKITGARFHKYMVLLTLEGITDRDAAELLMQKIVQVRRSELKELDDGRYYIFDIEGMAVYDTNDNELGTVAEVLQTGSNDVYVVKKDGVADLLLPAIKDVVLQIDIEHKKMVVNPPEWIEE